MDALNALRSCSENLATAVAESVTAAALLADSRQARAIELADTIRAALTICARLEFAVAADQQSAEHESRYQR